MTRFFSSLCLAVLAIGVSSAQTSAPLTSNQWIQPTQAGKFSGRVIVPAGNGAMRSVVGASVTMVSIDGGGFSGQAVTDGMGEFTISGVTPGVYSLRARASNAFAHTAMHVIDSGAQLDGRYPGVAEIAATNMNYDAVDRAISRYRPPRNSRVVSMANADLDALASAVVSDETFRVSQFDGGINGVLYGAGADGENLIPAAMSNVFIMRNGVEIGRAITSEMGDFRIDNVSPGSYSILAMGREGTLSMGFELVAPGGDVAQQSRDGSRFVTTVRAPNSLVAQCCWGEDDDDQDDGDDDPDDVDDGDGYPSPFTYIGGARGGPGSTGGSGSAGSASGIDSVAGVAAFGGILAGVISATTDNGPASPVLPPPTSADFILGSP
jgi:hypothetical protein